MKHDVLSRVVRLLRIVEVEIEDEPNLERSLARAEATIAYERELPADQREILLDFLRCILVLDAIDEERPRPR